MKFIVRVSVLYEKEIDVPNQASAKTFLLAQDPEVWSTWPEADIVYDVIDKNYDSLEDW